MITAGLGQPLKLSGKKRQHEKRQAKPQTEDEKDQKPEPGVTPSGNPAEQPKNKGTDTQGGEYNQNTKNAFEIRN